MSRTQIPVGSNETVLPSLSPEVLKALDGSRQSSDPAGELRKLLSQHPDCLEAWARLSSLVDDPIEVYAYARTGYHRGLDALRAAGWRGSGAVRWKHRSNLGFLASLAALSEASAVLGDHAEAQRCREFFEQCDPTVDLEAWRL